MGCYFFWAIKTRSSTNTYFLVVSTPRFECPPCIGKETRVLPTPYEKARKKRKRAGYGRGRRVVYPHVITTSLSLSSKSWKCPGGVAAATARTFVPLTFHDRASQMSFAWGAGGECLLRCAYSAPAVAPHPRPFHSGRLACLAHAAYALRFVAAPTSCEVALTEALIIVVRDQQPKLSQSRHQAGTGRDAACSAYPSLRRVRRGFGRTLRNVSARHRLTSLRLGTADGCSLRSHPPLAPRSARLKPPLQVA